MILRIRVKLSNKLKFYFPILFETMVLRNSPKNLNIINAEKVKTELNGFMVKKILNGERIWWVLNLFPLLPFVFPLLRLF